MKWLGVFAVSLCLGGLGAFAVAGSGPEPTAPPVQAPPKTLDLPTAPFSDWVRLGWSQDVTGRWVASGYRMDPRSVEALADLVMEHWAAQGRGGRVVPLEDGGAFLSSIDFSAGDQVTYLIEDRSGARTVLVGRTDFAAESSTARQHVGPALGGLSGGSTQQAKEGFNQAVEAKAAALREAGWTRIQEGAHEQRQQGRHSETWQLGHQVLQVDHVKTEDGQVMVREQRMPSAAEGP
ncbi:MAG: hypothetical protein CMH55_06780 [Myxococcales bacterium]|nr:hypothetical protein [Myxococcales bacterium]